MTLRGVLCGRWGIVSSAVSYILGMDTIIYFYQERSPVQREISLMYQEDYLFAKVGVCADRHNWFGCPIPRAPLPVEPMQEETCGGWFTRRRRMRERQRELKRKQREYMQSLQEYQERQEELAVSVRQLWEEVRSEVERAGGQGEIRCVYEDSLRFLAEGQGEAAFCWSPVWNIPEFRDYKSMRWLRPLLKYVRHSDYILLGAADCIPTVLQGLARQMKSLQWYLREEDLSEEIQEWVEDFYEEYGLAITLRELSGENAFRQLKLQSGEPVCVMDFTEEEKLFAGKLAGDSVWLDFASVEGKRRRIEKQAPEVGYMSLKKHWGAMTKRKPGIPKCHTASRFFPRPQGNGRELQTAGERP